MPARQQGAISADSQHEKGMSAGGQKGNDMNKYRKVFRAAAPTRNWQTIRLSFVSPGKLKHSNGGLSDKINATHDCGSTKQSGRRLNGTRHFAFDRSL
jgi:hypothetical protein